MTHWLLIMPCMLLGGLAFRVRGGMLEDLHLRGQLSRLAWGAMCAVTVGAAGWSLPALVIAPVVGLLAWISTMAGLHGTIDMGKNVDTDAEKSQSVRRRFIRDFIVGHLHGLVLGSAAAVPLAWLHWGCPLSPVPVCAHAPLALWYLPLVGGAAWGLVYAAADWLWADWSFLRRIDLGGIALGKNGVGPEAAEFGFGLEFIAALYFAVAI